MIARFEVRLMTVVAIIIPVPTAYLICAALIAREWWSPFAVVAAVALEGLGYFSARLIMGVMEHNRSLSAVEQGYKIPQWRAWLPVISYTVISIVFTVALKIAPDLYVYSLIAFPLLGLLSSWTFSEIRVLQSHAQSKALARLEAKEARQKAKSEPKKAKEATAKPKFICSCGFEAGSQAALNGHKLKHKPKKPAFDVDKALEPFEKRTGDL